MAWFGHRCYVCCRLTERRRAWKVAVSTVSSCICHRLVFVLLCTYFTQSHLFCKHTVSKVSLHKTRMSTAGYKLVSNNFPTGLSNEKLCRSRWQTGALAFVLNFGTVASCLRTFLFWVLQRRLCLAENNTWLVYTSDTVLEPEWTKQTLI